MDFIELLRAEQAHGPIQIVLLFMIWLSSRGVKKELVELKFSLNDHVRADETRFVNIEKKIKP